MYCKHAHVLILHALLLGLCLWCFVYIVISRFCCCHWL